MKRTILALATGLAIVGSAQAGNVGVSLSIGQPGFYGQIDIGNAPRPQLIYSQPVMVERVAVSAPPLYLVVPPGYQRNWSRHCREYGACGRQVYFVRQDWYDSVYVPHYRDHYYSGGWHDARRVDRDHDGVPDYRDRDRGQGWANGRPRDRDHDGIPDNRDRDHGNGNGHGNGRDRDRGHDRDHDRDRDRDHDRR